MTSMIERVARAIHMADEGLPRESWFSPANDAYWDHWWANDRKQMAAPALAALSALRDPTVEMLTAAQEEWMCVRAAEERGDFIWRAMIDTILAEHP